MSHAPHKLSASVTQCSSSLLSEQVGQWVDGRCLCTMVISIPLVGLNQITGSFKYVVGAVGFTVHGVMVMISSAAIIILHVALYFRNNLHTWTGANRTYLWFFSHYLYLAALMLTLHCMFNLIYLSTYPITTLLLRYRILTSFCGEDLACWCDSSN